MRKRTRKTVPARNLDSHRYWCDEIEQTSNNKNIVESQLEVEDSVGQTRGKHSNLVWGKLKRKTNERGTRTEQSNTAIKLLINGTFFFLFCPLLVLCWYFIPLLPARNKQVTFELGTFSFRLLFLKVLFVKLFFFCYASSRCAASIPILRDHEKVYPIFCYCSR